MSDYLIKSTIILTISLTFYHLVLGREKIHYFNRFYLLISIVVSFIIPFITIEIIKVIPVFVNIEPLISTSIPSEINENGINENAAPIVESINYIPYILWSFYALITLILLGRFAKNVFELISKTKSNPIIKYNNAKLVLVDEKVLPHTFLNYIFINFDDYNMRNIEDELFTHELVHVNQKHSLDILFIELLKVLFWFNPIFIFYKKAIQLNHEFLADGEIVRTYNDVPFYQNLLLHKGNGNQTIYLASNLNYLVTKKRLIMMTKITSPKTALLKKVAILPILAGLIYFFCIEVVAQQKVINTNSKSISSELNDKDKIRDSYYRGVYVKIIDEKNNKNISTLYENLSLEDRRKYFYYIPEMIIENEIPEPLFEKMKVKNMAVWINGKVRTTEEIKKYKRSDFSFYTYSFVHKNARSKRFPQEYQYSLYTKKYFDVNLKNSHLHFSGDTIKICSVSYKNALKNVVKPRTKADTLVWYSKGKDGYNLYINENNKIKTIVIDAGHGGYDFGASKEGLTEKSLAEIISHNIQDRNKNEDIKIHFTRTNDSFIDLTERARIVNSYQPDLAISLHFNMNKNIETNGFEIYVSDSSPTSEKSIELANQLAAIIANATPLKNRGVKVAPFMILKKSECPTMVVELGFLSNEKDRNYVNSEKGQTEIAQAILNFVSGLEK
jgi:N-acetylmuramoyl-L-alanine amidase/beta-lactamase regulating signal transducer with metallopeptidase domain